MPLSDTCPHCRTPHRLADDLDGRLIRCKSCGETFRVGGERSEDDYDDDPRPRRHHRSESSALVPLLVVGGLLGAIMIAGGGVLLWYLARSARARPTVMTVQKQVITPNAIVPEHTLMPPRPPGALGGPAEPVEPVEGPEKFILMNPRRAEGMAPGRPTYRIDYQIPGVAPAPNEWYYLVAKVPGGISDAHLFRLHGQAQVTISFSFFPGRDPGPGFEFWIEERPPGKPKERIRVSKVVTMP